MPRCDHLVQGGGAFRIIGDVVNVGAREDELRADGRCAVRNLCEAVHHAKGIF